MAWWDSCAGSLGLLEDLVFSQTFCSRFLINDLLGPYKMIPQWVSSQRTLASSFFSMDQLWAIFLSNVTVNLDIPFWVQNSLSFFLCQIRSLEDMCQRKAAGHWPSNTRHNQCSINQTWNCTKKQLILAG